MRRALLELLRCPRCSGSLRVRSAGTEAAEHLVLDCDCGDTHPIEAGVPRLLPAEASRASVKTQRAFADEWQRFPEVLDVHRGIFDWYFEGPTPVPWRGLRILDAGCGMGRWLHFALDKGAEGVGMDVSPAIDVAAARDGHRADFVQADLRWPPFPAESFDLVYSLGVVHHLEDPLVGVRALSKLVRPGGELRLYVYRTLEDAPFAKRLLLRAVSALRSLTTRLPYGVVHGVSWAIAVLATALFLAPRRLLRRWESGDRLTRALPLLQYTDVPFRMLVSEQFDRLVAPIEGRFTREQVEEWLRAVGFDLVAILPGLGWRAIGRRPVR